MTTARQALELWCPFVRVHVPAGVINRVSSALRRIAEKARGSGNIADAEYIEEQGRDTHCVAHHCMAWRTLPIVDGQPVDRGYCGLAGRP